MERVKTTICDLKFIQQAQQDRKHSEIEELEKRNRQSKTKHEFLF